MTYEQFVEAINNRPEGQSPLECVASMNDRPAEAAEWLVRWLKEKRET